jgi:hypothetical protein
VDGALFFMSRSIEPCRRTAALALTGLGAVLLAGCATESDMAARSTIPPNSPLAQAVAAVKSEPQPAPSYRNIPLNPPQMRPAGAWEQTATALQGQGRELAGIAAIPVEIPDPDAWAKRTAAAAGLDAITPPGPNNAAELEAYARELRERATPPPPPR